MVAMVALWVVFVICVAFCIIEVIAGWCINPYNVKEPSDGE